MYTKKLTYWIIVLLSEPNENCNESVVPIHNAVIGKHIFMFRNLGFKTDKYELIDPENRQDL